MHATLCSETVPKRSISDFGKGYLFKLKYFSYNFQFDVQHFNYTRTEKEYDADPDKKYPRLDLELFFKQKMVFENNAAKFNPDYPSQ